MALAQTEPKKIYIWSSEVKAVYLWTTQVRLAWWQPWANTVAYRPYQQDIDEHSGKNYTPTGTNIVYSTLGWVQCANVGASWWVTAVSDILDGSASRTEQTMSFWMYLKALPNWTSRYTFEWQKQWLYSCYFLARSNNVYRYEWVGAGSTIDVSIPSSDIWTWVYFTLVNSASWKYMYKNGVQIWTWTWSSRPWGNRPNDYQQANNNFCDRGGTATGGNLGLRELIWENRVWTAQEISDYYDQTKWDYWIS